jgi:hypothetical protein
VIHRQQSKKEKISTIAGCETDAVGRARGKHHVRKMMKEKILNQSG